MSSGASKWVKLNVGGQPFQTTLTTLLSCPDSLLAKMFDPESGLEPAYSEDGVYFLDSDPKYFSVILNWLRYKEVMVESDMNPHNVAKVANFFGLEELAEKLKFAGAVIILSDDGRTSELSGSDIGLYFKEDGNVYRQAGGDNYLFQTSSGVWHINAKINEEGFILRNASNIKSNVLPREGWEYHDDDEEDGWIKDPSLRIIDATKFNFCNEIVLSSTKYSKKGNKEFLGAFRRAPHDWSCGWPVFKNKEGNQLGVFMETYWSVISENRHSFKSQFISSSRVTGCPASVNAGVSSSYKYWQYSDRGGYPWIDDDTLKVKCDVHN